MIEKNKIRTQSFTFFVFACCSAVFFQYLYPYHLFFKEQTQLFLFTSDYFLSYFDKPAWLSCYMGDFITQFFYLNGGGAIVLTLIFLIELLLIRNILKIFSETPSFLLALFPVIFDWIFHCELNYFVSASVAMIIVLSSFLLFYLIKNDKLSFITALFFVPVIYNLAGSLSFLFPFLVFFADIKNGRNRWQLWLLLMMFAGLFPLFLQSVHLITIRQAYLHPLISTKHSAVSLCLLLILFCLQFSFFQKITFSTGRSILFFLPLLFALLIAGLQHSADFHREKIFALATETYFENPDKVILLSDKYKLQNNIATYYTNLALSQKGMMPEKLFDYYQPASNGLFLPVNTQSGWITIFFSNDVFFHLGDMNMAQHAAMLGQTFSVKHRSSRIVKRLAEINLVNGDTAVARKYLRMLDATLFHSEWAASLENMIDGKDTPADSVRKTSDGKTIAVDSIDRFIEMRARIIKHDTLRKASDYVTSLRLLVESNPENTYAMNYLLCYYLLNKDVSPFYTTFEKYIKQNSANHSTLYMEALMITLFKDKAPPKKIKSLGITDEVITNFVEYTKLFDESNGNMDLIREKYGSTYWFYYHFAQMKEK